MKIAICSSLNFVSRIKDISVKLEKDGHFVLLPRTAEMVIKGEVTQEQIKKEKDSGGFVERTIKQDSIRGHFEKIKNSDAILVLNFEKKGIKNYIGGAVFLEMGFAHVLGKKIFLLNPVPEVSYKDEVLAMKPVVIGNDLNKVK